MTTKVPDQGARVSKGWRARLSGVSVRYGFMALALVFLARLAVDAGVFSARWLAGLVFLVVAAYPVMLAAAWTRGQIGVASGPGALDDSPAGSAGEPGSALRAPFVGAAGLVCVLLAAWIGLRPAEEGRPEPEMPALPATPRVIVLPLIDIEGGGDHYFSTGLTDELAAGFATIEGLEVRGRASAAGFVDVNRDAAAVGRRLGADVVLDGTVRRYGGRLRLGVRLVEVATGEVLWSMSRDTTRAALFALRDDAVRGVAETLGLGSPEDRSLRRLERRRTNVEALDLYMLGRRRGVGPQGDLLEAASYYHLAIEADSGFAPAWTALAEAYATLPRFTRFPPDRARGEGSAAARTALRLEPDAAAAHAVLGEILYLYERDWPGARSHLERAIELDPGSADARERLCELSLILGEVDAADVSCAEALTRDPLAFRPAWTAAGVDRVSGDLDAALARLDSLVRVQPGFEPLVADHALTRLVAGDTTGLAGHLAAWFGLLGPAELADTLAAALVDAWPPAAGALPAGRAPLARVEAELDPSPVHLAALLSLFGHGERASEVAISALTDRVPGTLMFGVLPEYAALRERDEVRRRLSEAGLAVR
jgi:TolB-like protein